jgi:hypothetical protein
MGQSVNKRCETSNFFSKFKTNFYFNFFLEPLLYLNIPQTNNSYDPKLTSQMKHLFLNKRSTRQMNKWNQFRPNKQFCAKALYM